MSKGQLSRIPWLGNTWMLFTFQPALQVIQQPHKHSLSLQLATDTQLGHHYIHYALWTHSKRISSKYCAATSKHLNGTWKGH